MNIRRKLVIALGASALAAPFGTFAQQPADCSGGPIPERALELSIGSEKVPDLPLISVRKISEMRFGDKEVYEQYAVSMRDKEMFEDIKTEFSVIVPKGQQPDGKTFRKLPTSDTKSQPGPQGSPEVQSWAVKHKAKGVNASHVGFIASLRVEFGKRRGDVLPGRVYLCIPGAQTERMFGTKLPDPITLVGRFEAKIQ